MKNSYPQETKNLAQELRQQGLSYRAIAERLNVPQPTIRYWLSEKHREQQKKYEKTDKRKQSHKKWLVSSGYYYPSSNNYVPGADLSPEQQEARRNYWREYAKKHAEKRRQAAKDWGQKNPDKVTAKSNRRRTRKLAVPQPHSIIEQLMVDNYYLLAKELQEKTGNLYHVDHIWPVSKGGPHLPWNLQVLPAVENLQKGAKI